MPAFIQDIDNMVPIDTILPPSVAVRVGWTASFIEAPLVRALGWTSPVQHLDAEGVSRSGPLRRQPGQWSVINGLYGYGPEEHERARRS